MLRLAHEFPLMITTMPLASPKGQEMALIGGILFAPGIFFDGVPICYGRPSERRLRRELEQRRIRVITKHMQQ